MLHFSEAYGKQIGSQYGAAIAADLDEWHSVPLPGQPGESIDFVRPKAGSGIKGTKPTLFINGFGAGIVASAPFTAAMASRGYDILLTNQNRTADLLGG